MEVIKVMKLEKAVKPYTRTRRGKLEHVSGHERKGLRRVRTIGDILVDVARGLHPPKKKFEFSPKKESEKTQVEKDFEAISRWQKEQEEKHMKKSEVLVVSLDEMQKAVAVKPYTRTRKGKMERVGEYTRAGEIARKEAPAGGKPSEEEEYNKLKEFGHLLNEEGKTRLAELEKKFGEEKFKREHFLLRHMAKESPEHLTDTAKKRLEELEAKYGEKKAEPKPKAKKAPPKEEVELRDIGPKKEEAKEEVKAPEEKKEAPKVEGASELAEALHVKLTSGPEKYAGFFSSKGALNLDKYHSELKDAEKMECLIHGVGAYTERYVEKAKAGDIWKDEEFKKINGEIGRSEGIRRAFIAKAKGYENPKDIRQALHVALGYQSKTWWPERFAEFNKSIESEGLKIFTIGDLYKAKRRK